MPDTLPSCAVKYSQSPEFSDTTIPKALQRDHATKPGVWGRIVVSEGELLYLRENRPAALVSPQTPATILPAEPHYVRPRGPVRFHVEFYRCADQGAKA